jgi:hypothetical protein
MLTGTEVVSRLTIESCNIMSANPPGGDNYTLAEVRTMMVKAGIAGLKLGCTMTTAEIHAKLALNNARRI